MIMAIGLNRFDFIPSLNWGKLWSFLKVKRPTRPVSTLKRTSPIAWVMMSSIARFPMGFVFQSEDGQRLIYAEFECDEQPNSRVNIGHYIDRTPKDFLENTPPVYKDGRKREGMVLEADIGPKKADVTPEDVAWVKRCFDPDNKRTFTANPTLG
jgi:hypothetical protein